MKADWLLDLVLIVFRVNDNEVVKVDNKTNKMIVNLSKNSKSRKLTYMPNIKAIKKSIFLTPNAKKIFNHLK